jgi:hypothetical protein
MGAILVNVYDTIPYFGHNFKEFDPEMRDINRYFFLDITIITKNTAAKGLRLGIILCFLKIFVDKHKIHPYD